MYKAVRLHSRFVDHEGWLFREQEMSINISSERMALFAFNDSHCLDSRDLIEGLQFTKDKLKLDEVDFKNARGNLKGSKDTSILGKKSSKDGLSENAPVKPCLMVPKGVDTDEKMEVRKAKSVHFADSCGLALTSVSTLFDSDDDLFNFKNFTRNKGLAERNSFPTFKKGTQFDKRQRSKLLNFVQPVTLPDYHQKLSSNKVGLENVVMREFSVYGTIVVMNLDFQKNVFVRYTTDAWQTNFDAKGVHLPGSSTGRTDTFSFEIPVSGTGSEHNIEFCVGYETPSDSFWDNNNGQNYRILFHRKRSESAKKDESEGFVLGPASQRFAGYNM